MKKKLLIVFVFMTLGIKAQFNETTLIYGTIDVNLGNYLGIEANINYINKEKYSFKIGYSGYIRATKYAPSDYKGGFYFRAHDRLGNYHLLVGRIYNLDKRKKIRTNIALGLGYLIVREPINWELKGDRKQYYTYDYGRVNTMSIILNPKIEFLFTNSYGLYISPTLMISKDKTYIGLGVGQLFRIIKKYKH